MAKLTFSQRAIMTKCTDLFDEPHENFRARYLYRPGTLVMYKLEECEFYAGSHYFIFVPEDGEYYGSYLRSSAGDYTADGTGLKMTTCNSVYTFHLLKNLPDSGYTTTQVRMIDGYLSKITKTDEQFKSSIEHLYSEAPSEFDVKLLRRVLLEMRLVLDGLQFSEARAVADEVYGSEVAVT